MQLGMIGLGRMGGAMARRLHKAGHQLVVFDRSDKSVAELAAAGMTGASGLTDLVAKLNRREQSGLCFPPEQSPRPPSPN
jgi:6-phosphogluconate dehydrogenase